MKRIINNNSKLYNVNVVKTSYIYILKLKVIFLNSKYIILSHKIKLSEISIYNFQHICLKSYIGISKLRSKIVFKLFKNINYFKFLKGSYSYILYFNTKSSIKEFFSNDFYSNSIDIYALNINKYFVNSIYIKNIHYIFNIFSNNYNILLLFCYYFVVILLKIIYNIIKVFILSLKKLDLK